MITLPLYSFISSTVLGTSQTLIGESLNLEVLPSAVNERTEYGIYEAVEKKYLF